MNEMEFVEFWAYKCQKNMKKCQEEVNAMVDSQIKIGNDFYKRLGREKALKLINS